VLEYDEFGKVRPTPGVMPAKAGIHLFLGVVHVAWRWIPAFAGMTPWIWPGCRKVRTLQIAGSILM
jgi:hypothetical protein